MKPQYMNTLYQHASEYKFNEFSELLLEYEANLSDASLRDAYLMQAQIKLYSSDHTLLEDLEKAAALDVSTPPHFPCLENQWLPDNIDRFIIFPPDSENFTKFEACLPQAELLLGRCYKEEGAGMVQLIRAEILYFQAQFEQALDFASKRYEACKDNAPIALMALFEVMRCHFAMGHTEQAEQYVLDMVRTAKCNPESLSAYDNARIWLNTATSWSGDNPRYRRKDNKEIFPVLEDRAHEIKKGVGQLAAKEQAFAAYAKKRYPNAYGSRQFYVDVFHAIRLFNLKALSMAKEYFQRAYQAASETGMVMPFVEYGKQLLPLLDFIRSSELGCDEDWLNMVSALSEQYEKCIVAYRSEL